MNSRLCFGFLACSFHHCCGQLTPVSSEGKWGSCWLDRLAPSAPLQHSLATDSLCSVNRSGFEPAEPSLASIALASMPPIKIDQNRREKLDLLCALPSYVITIRWSFEEGKSLLGEELKIGNPIIPTLIFSQHMIWSIIYVACDVLWKQLKKEKRELDWNFLEKIRIPTKTK